MSPTRPGRVRRSTAVPMTLTSFMSVFGDDDKFPKEYFKRGPRQCIRMVFQSPEPLVEVFGNNWHTTFFENPDNRVQSRIAVQIRSSEQVRITK